MSYSQQPPFESWLKVKSKENSPLMVCAQEADYTLCQCNFNTERLSLDHNFPMNRTWCPCHPNQTKARLPLLKVSSLLSCSLVISEWCRGQDSVFPLCWQMDKWMSNYHSEYDCLSDFMIWLHASLCVADESVWRLAQTKLTLAKAHQMLRLHALCSVLSAGSVPLLLLH